MTVWASEIASFLSRSLVGNDVLVTQARPVTSPAANSLVFIQKYAPEVLHSLNQTEDVLVLASPRYEGRLTVSHIVTPRPRLDAARVLKNFFSFAKSRGIAITAVIAPTASLGKDVSVGHFSVIGENVRIGDNTEVREHVIIRDNCVIGHNCLIRSNAVIGEEGFGFEFGNPVIAVHMPHLGRVVTGDEVEIGSFCAIHRGTLGDTFLARGVIVGDHAIIGHNVEIGEDSFVIGGAIVNGSVRIGKNAWIAPQSVIIQHVDIGDNAMVGLGAVVVRSVSPNTVVFGNPAKVLRKRFSKAPQDLLTDV